MNEDNIFYYINAATGKSSNVPLYLDKEQAEILNQAADEAGLTGDLRKSFFTTVFIESGKTMTKEINGKKVKVFTPDVNAVSSAGAKGAFQFMPTTAAELGINPLDFKESAFASAKYIRNLFELAVQRGEKDPVEAASVYYNRGQRDGYQTGTKLDKELPDETKGYIKKKKLNSEAATQIVNNTLGIVDSNQEDIQYDNIQQELSLPKSYLGDRLNRYTARWDNPLSKAIADRNLVKDSKYFEKGGYLDNDPIKYGSKEYRDAYNKGTITNYDVKQDLHIAKDLPTAKGVGEAPKWLLAQREYEKKYPKPDAPTEGPNKALGLKSGRQIEWESNRDKYVAKAIEKDNPILKNKKITRGERLNTLTDKEQELLLKGLPKYNTSLWQDAKRGLGAIVEASVGQPLPILISPDNYSKKEIKERILSAANSPKMNKAGEILGVLAPLTVPAKMVQAPFISDYNMSDAMSGTKNDVGLVGDIVTDPLNLVGLGLWSKVSKLGKFNKLDDLYKAIGHLPEKEQLRVVEELANQNNDVLNTLNKQLNDLKIQQKQADDARIALWNDYKEKRITPAEYKEKYNELGIIERNDAIYSTSKKLREETVKQNIKNTPQENILQSESQLGKNISDGGSNSKGVFELGNDYVARLSAHGYDDASLLLNYKNKIKSPRIAKTLQVKEIDGKVYQVQEKVTGTPIDELDNFDNIPQEHIDNFWKDKAELDELGLSIDISGGKSNIFYDKDKGFQFIDLGIGESPTNDLIKQVYPNFNRSSNYPSQIEAVQARADRMLAQEHKWRGQDNNLIRDRFKNAATNHIPEGDYPASLLGVNKGTHTIVSKNANLSDANKSRIAAHETGHYYRNRKNEANEWNKLFNLNEIKNAKVRDYLRGEKPSAIDDYVPIDENKLPNINDLLNNKSNIDLLPSKGVYHGDELRERAAQLKDYIAYKNNIPLDKDFVITKEQLEDAILNYIKDTGLDNSMQPFLDSIIDVDELLKMMNKSALAIPPAAIITNNLVNQKESTEMYKKGGYINNRIKKYFENGGFTQSTQEEKQQDADKKSLITPQGLMNTASTVIGDIGKLNDNSKRNNAEAIGGIIGTAIDTTAMAFGIPTFGLGNKAGNIIGGQFANKALTNPNSFYKTGFKNGGQINTKAVEIEKDEYVFNPNGIDESKFKMTNSLGNKFKSNVGFLVDGNTHNNGGIEVIEGNAYIASNHLGVDGKKATNKNKSVAKVMLEQGGKVLAQASDYDKFSVSKKNTPNAYNYILKNMQNVAKKAETNKKIEEQIKQINNQMKNYKSNPLNYTYNPDLYQYMEDGGMMQDPAMMQQQQATPQVQEESIMAQIPPEQQEQVMQMAQAAMQGDKQAMQQLVDMLGEEGVQMLMQELQENQQQQQQPVNPSNQAAMQAMSKAPAAMMQNGGYMQALTRQYAKKYLR